MERYSASEVIEMGVQTERLGFQFYTDMAERFEKDEKLRGLFEVLAAKEQEHEKTFAGLHDKVGDRPPEGWGEAAKYLRAIVESEFFLGKNKSLPPLEHINSIEDAVKYAIGFERETLLFYYGLKDVLKENPVLNTIINEEKSHIIWLNDFRKSLGTV